MGFWNIAIPTGILWFLNGVVITPIAEWLTSRKLALANVPENIEGMAEETREELKKTFTAYYILMDVLVLGIAGLIGGLLGYYFLGFSLSVRDWPGMIVFIAASFLGVAVVGGPKV